MSQKNLHVTADCLTPFLPTDITSLAVAVSGGADSLALTFLANEWCNTHGVTLHALTVDHGLRDTSTTEATTVHNLLKAHGISHHILTWEHDIKPEQNIHHTAREARYNLMTHWCKAHHISHILLGHHYDDQVENVLIRLLRGSGVDGLAAMQPITARGAITLVRPLLHIPKAFLEAYLHERNITWLVDPSNEDTRYTRAQIRAFLQDPSALTDDPDLLKKRLNDMATHMARTRDYLEHQTDIAFTHSVTLHPLGFAVLDDAAFKALHPEIGLRVLALLLGKIGGNRYRPRFEKLERLYMRLSDNTAFPGATLEGCELLPYRKHETLIIREYNDISPRVLLEAGTHCWDGRFTLTLDTPATIGPLGKEGLAQLKEKQSLPWPKKCYYGIPAYWQDNTLIKPACKL